LKPLITSWQRQPGATHAQPPNPRQRSYSSRNHKPPGLPPPPELAQRVEEARTSSKLLLQVIQSTPPAELLGNELVKEFVERCQSASRSIQGYIHSDNPPPDADTLLTLIETNDQISTAISRHQRAYLQARRLTGAPSIAPSPSAPTGGLFEVSGSQLSGVPMAKSVNSPLPPPLRRHPQPLPLDPFDDRHESDLPRSETMQAPLEPRNYGLSASSGQQNGTHAPTVYHTDFQPMSPYDDRQDYAANHRTMHGATAMNEAVSPEEVRRPVQYRF
jgi:hypothetical protein